LFNGFYRKSKEGIVTLSFLDIKHCRFLSVIYLRDGCVKTFPFYLDNFYRIISTFGICKKRVFGKNQYPSKNRFDNNSSYCYYFGIQHADEFVVSFFKNDKVPLWLLIFGSLGQITFTFRFVYQWIYSVKRKESVLPIGFWVISLIGSFIIIAYGIIRKDPVLILGQSVGFIAYTRNIIIALNDKNVISE